MDCSQVRDALDLLMDGALDDAQRQAMEAHGRECPDCAAAIRSTLQMKALFDQMEPEADVPLEAQAAWRGAVRAEAKRQKQRRLTRWIASAAAAVVAVVGVGMAFRLHGAPKQSAAPLYEAKLAAAQDAETAAEPALASGGAVAGLRSNEAPGAVVEADGMADEAVAFEEAAMDMAEEAAYQANEAPVQRATACELTLRVDDVDIACDRIRDLAQEYEAVAEAQPAGEGRANVYVEIASENAGDFMNAVVPMDTSGKAVDVPALSGGGRVLVLLALHS